MKTLIATLIASAASASIAIAPASAQSNDAYRTAIDKANADYKAAQEKCEPLIGNRQDVCEAEAELRQARAEVEAATRHDKNNLQAAHRKLIDAQHELAEEKCEALRGNAQDKCEEQAEKVRETALAKLGNRDGNTAAGGSGAGMVASTDTRDPKMANAVERCEKMTGDAKTACLVDNKGNVTTAGAATAGVGATVAERTRDAVATVKEKASNMVEKTKDMASNAGQRTENAAERADERTGLANSDAVITTKVKASLVAEKELSGMDINVETEKGVVMLSGFVESKAEADKAVRVAKGVEGVTSVKSAIKVK